MVGSTLSYNHDRTRERGGKQPRAEFLGRRDGIEMSRLLSLSPLVFSCFRSQWGNDGFAGEKEGLKPRSWTKTA